MRRFVWLAATFFVLIVTGMAFAGSDIPDLRGTWVMKGQAIVHEKMDETQPERHVDVRKGLAEVDFAMTIDRQEGFRFSGVKSSDKRKESVSGVIGFDNQTVYMVDDDGIMICRLTGPDEMEQVYLHITPHRSVAARMIMTRKH